MHFYWIRDCIRQGQFHIYWKPGTLNKANYFTKHHPASHHQEICSAFLHSTTDPSKNYFNCLQDKEPLPSTDSGEGVLNSRVTRK
jgi:hypothetical protein